MQRDVLAALLIGVVSNLDNLGVGVSFGIRGTRIDAMANLIVAGITMAVTAASLTCGHVLSKILPSAVTGWLGPLIIIAIGFGTALPSARTSRRSAPSQVPSGASGRPRDVDDIISWREAIVLGIALAVNNLGTGVGAGVSGIPASPTIVSAGLLSLAALGGGARFGRRFGRLVLGRYAPLIAGMLLLAVGTAMLPNVR
jgi:putative sporulation protein YtaF